ncbi:hypothetical protein M5K25_014620 [Dendrobium thyrsiflorum]|uniref:Uncharacterized protein n=1 Tax=Dendrobium thyrsiflorum TaxID=117978 RepID=A0ABD0UUZ3_DENTH
MNGLDEIPRSDLARRDQTAGSRSRGTAAVGALDRELYSMEGFDLIPPESTSPAALTGWVLVGKFKERKHDDSHLSLRKRNWKTFEGRKHCFPQKVRMLNLKGLILV